MVVVIASSEGPKEAATAKNSRTQCTNALIYSNTQTVHMFEYLALHESSEVVLLPANLRAWAQGSAAAAAAAAATCRNNASGARSLQMRFARDTAAM